MSVLQIVMFYLLIGAVCGFCFEYLMGEFKLRDEVSLSERLGWILLWPIFTLIFIWGMRK